METKHKTEKVNENQEFLECLVLLLFSRPPLLPFRPENRKKKRRKMESWSNKKRGNVSTLLRRIDGSLPAVILFKMPSRFLQDSRPFSG